MSNVYPITASSDTVGILRWLADEIEAGNIESRDVTVIAGAEIFHCGHVDEARLAESAVFNMVFGLSKMMHAINKAMD